MQAIIPLLSVLVPAYFLLKHSATAGRDVTLTLDDAPEPMQTEDVEDNGGFEPVPSRAALLSSFADAQLSALAALVNAPVPELLGALAPQVVAFACVGASARFAGLAIGRQAGNAMDELAGLVRMLQRTQIAVYIPVVGARR